MTDLTGARRIGVPSAMSDLDAQRAAYNAQQERLEAHYRLRPPHPNEAILKQMADNPDLPHNEEYWQKRRLLFHAVYEAIEEWSQRFWATETRIPDPDDQDEL